MATFPGGVSSFPTLVDLVDSVLAAHQNEPNREIEAIQLYLLESILNQGRLVNGHFQRTVSSNNLTVAIKTNDSGDPSTDNPVYIKIGGTIRSITSALSVTVNAGAASGTGTFRLGATEFANLEQELFVYLGWNAASAVVFLGISRAPFGRVYSEFSATAANEKYLAVSTTPASTDIMENIGRFNITNSGSASYNWSVPATDIVVNRPIYETRPLSWQPIYTAGGTGSPAYGTVTTTLSKYQFVSKRVKLAHHSSGTLSGTTVSGVNFTLPWEAADIASTLPMGNAKVDGGKLGNIEMAAGTPDLGSCVRYDAANFTLGATVLKAYGDYEAA